MSITVRLFASLRERIGFDEARLDETPATVAEAWQRVTDIERPSNTLAAVNHEYVDLDHPLSDDDEVAFFPPVTGG
ncbi:MoaD/ThiS family protein [Guyparkeria sp.]|uniref:MoaD/ThiS family protein n=1 Tax=Guyparkeria sp. TaxID=2035736 RepID=UPI00397095D7